MSLPTPPPASRKPHAMREHGRTRTDDYFWLRERDNPDVIAYLEAENAYTEAMTAHTADLRRTLFEEMKGRIKETDLDVPEQIDDYFYYTRTAEGKQYPIHCRRRGSMNGPEDVLLDENVLAEGHDYFRVGVFETSPDHRWLAYSVDYDGDEIYTLCIKDLSAGELLPERIPNTYYGAAWMNDNRALVYATLDAAKRPYRAFRHTIGDDPSNDTLLYEESDELFFLGVGKTSDRRYIRIASHAFENSEERVLSADRAGGELRVIEPRAKGTEYYTDHAPIGWLILTNVDGATNFKLMTAPDDSPGRAHWREFVAHRPNVFIESMMPFKDYVVRAEREGGLRRIRITDAAGGNERDVNFPEAAYAVWPHHLDTFDTHTLRFTYESPITPDQVVDYDMRDGTWDVRKQEEIPSGYDRSRYTTQRIEATGHDGVRVPMTVAYRKGTRDDGPAPTVLYGYGAYGAVVEPGFDARRLSLLDRGVVYAMAHVRGGAEMGRKWYDDGKLFNKKNSFTDFIACAEHLVGRGYTTPDKLAIRGISAGGLLVGAAVTMRPDLFKAVIAEVPFVDVISTMFDLSIPLTAAELEQWGDPRDPAFYKAMLAYSPYDNVQALDYPSMLVTAGLNDPRVQYWEPAKFVAKLRACKTDDNLVLLKTQMGAGHGGPSGRYDALHEEAFKQAFVLDRLGMTA